MARPPILVDAPRWTWRAERKWVECAEVRSPDECWMWSGSAYVCHIHEKGDQRKGSMKLEGVDGKRHTYYVERIAWWRHHGRWPGAMCVMHKCRETLCVNPAHLILVQPGAVAKVAATRGTMHRGRPQQHRTEMTEELVREIRDMHASGLGYFAIARAVDVSSSRVSSIIKRTTYAWVDPPSGSTFERLHEATERALRLRRVARRFDGESRDRLLDYAAKAEEERDALYAQWGREIDAESAARSGR